MLVVTHTAGKTPQPISASTPKEGIYHHHMWLTPNIDQGLTEATNWVWSRGPDAGASIAHAAQNSSDDYVIAAISWDHVQESSLKETASRPSECVCNIF